ncbi:hypothetical protein ACQKKK_05480 [Peribacillus sp. NPDC006672]|uniref:hypothetical protein n=1 Tax=Peribacillus sp. NPDC006672 TaxID=3390606 RepID=UPI003D087AA9
MKEQLYHKYKEIIMTKRDGIRGRESELATPYREEIYHYLNGQPFSRSFPWRYILGWAPPLSGYSLSKILDLHVGHVTSL